MGAKPRPNRAPAAAAGSAEAAVRATVSIRGGGMLYIDAPAAFVRAIGTESRVAVRGTLNRASFDGAIVPIGGALRLLVNRDLAARAGVYAGALARLHLVRVGEPSRQSRARAAPDQPGQPDPGQPDPGQPDPGQPDPGQPDPGQPDPG